MASNEITTSNGFRYTLTPEDKLWAARMIAGEGGSPAAVLWTMASRFVLTHSSGRTPAGSGAFTNFIRSYSQPINPCWYRDATVRCSSGGAGCGPGSSYDVGAPCRDGVNNPCCAGLLDRREHMSTLEGAQLAPWSAIVERWAAGQTPNPVPKAVHFAVPRLIQDCLDAGRCSHLIARLGNSAHASVAASDSWPSSFVRVGGAGDGSGAGGGALAVVLGLALGAGALALSQRGYKRRKPAKSDLGAPRGYIRKPKPDRSLVYGDEAFWKAAKKAAAQTAKTQSSAAAARLLTPAQQAELKKQMKREQREAAFWRESRKAAGLPVQESKPKTDEDPEDAHYTQASHQSMRWGKG